MIVNILTFEKAAVDYLSVFKRWESTNSRSWRRKREKWPTSPFEHAAS